MSIDSYVIIISIGIISSHIRLHINIQCESTHQSTTLQTLQNRDYNEPNSFTSWQFATNTQSSCPALHHLTSSCQ